MWTIEVSFTDATIIPVLFVKTKVDRRFGTFSEPVRAHEYLVNHGWKCSPAIHYDSKNYYTKGNCIAKIACLRVEDLSILDRLGEHCTVEKTNEQQTLRDANSD